MTHDALGYWPDWRNKLIQESRRWEVPGGKIGDILLETDYHLKDTGESPESAFGDPRDYARRRANMLNTSDETMDGVEMSWWLIGLSVVGGAGGIMAALAAWSIGAGTVTSEWIIPTWLLLVAGVVLMIVPLYIIGTDRVTDPRTGQPLLGENRLLNQVASVGFGIITLLALAILAWVVNR